MISYSQKVSDKDATQPESTLTSRPQNRANFRCSQNLKDALERSEELLHKAEALQKEFGKKSAKP